MAYNGIHTAFDVIKEFLISGAELTEMGFPVLPAGKAPGLTMDICLRILKKVRKH